MDKTTNVVAAANLEALMLEREALKAVFDCSDEAWQAVFEIERRIIAAGGIHRISRYYDGD